MRTYSILALIFICGLFPAADAATVDHPSKLKFPKHEFKLPKTERVELNNGMTLHLMEDHELPLVNISSMVRIGSAYEPAEKIGLASLTGSVWRSGGTMTTPPAKLDEELEFISASIETSIGMKSGSVSLSVLKKDLDTGLRLFADIIKNPAFDKKRFQVAKNQILEGIRRQNDEPDSIVGREFNKALLPAHPFGRSPTLQTVNGISRSDIVNFYNDYVGPESFIVGISGDFDSKDIVKRFEKLFAGFKPAPKKLRPYPPVPDKTEPGLYIVDKNLPQSALRMGHIGISRKNPDYFAVRVMNFVLGGGGFSSRLMQEIRSNKGLAYSVWSYYFGGESDKGMFLLGGETKAESTAEFIRIARDIMRLMVEKGVTEKELSLAKESMVNRFIFGFDNTAKIVSQYVWTEYHSLPKSWLEDFRKNIQKVTMSDVKKSAGKYLRPDEMTIMIVGEKKRFEKDISEFGRINIIKLEK